MENPAVVILSHNRVEYVTQTLRSLLKMPQIKKYRCMCLSMIQFFETIEARVGCKSLAAKRWPILKY